MKYIMTILILGSSAITAAKLEVVSRGNVDLSAYESVSHKNTKSDIYQKESKSQANKNSNKEEKNYTKVTIKEGGINRTVLVEDVSNSALPTSDDNTTKILKRNKLHSRVGLIVDFKDKNVNIEEFAIQYDLKFKRKMSIGYYIFENKSTQEDIEIVKAILSTKMKDSIITIKPNWSLQMRPF